MRFFVGVALFCVLSTAGASASPNDVYLLPSGGRAVIATVHPPHGGDQLLFVRTDTGAVRFMTPASKDTWTIGKLLVPNGSIEATVRSTGNTITIESAAGKTLARRFALREAHVSFENAGLLLHGTILRPATGTKFPGIVLMHGSDVTPRDDNGFIPYFFASHGFAVLIYDKRGSGESVPFTGYADMQMLAGDGISAVRALSQSPGVDGTRVGVWGASQGGMLAILMAGMDPLINFAIDQSGYFTPTWQADLFEVQSALRDMHLSDADIANATAFETQKYEAARTGIGWDELASAAARYKSAPWFNNVFMPASEAALQRYWTRHAAFDPSQGAPVHAKVLGLYGSLDTSSPMPQSPDNLLAFLARSGNANSTIAVFPNVNHLMMDAKTGNMSEVMTLTNYSVPYLRTLTTFIDGI